MSAPDDRDALLAFLEGRSDVPPEALDDALLESDDPALDVAFAAVARQLVSTDPDDGVVDAAWARVQQRIGPPEATVITPPAAVRRRWGMVVGAVAALAAGLLIFALRPATPPVADPYVKGAGALSLDVDFVREDGAAFPAVATQRDRIVPRARIAERGVLTLAHVRPDGAVQVLPFAPGPLPPGTHAPQRDGARMAYAFDGEPGAHRFVVFATRSAPAEADVRAWLRDTPPTTVAARDFRCEIR